MGNKILSIERKPMPETAPDGNYKGVLSGSIIQFTAKGNEYLAKVEEGIRGRAEVVVCIKGGISTYIDLDN